MENECTEYVKALIKKAAEAEKADDAMKLSQAACNAANALCAMASIPKQK